MRSKATMLAAVVPVALALALTFSSAFELTACPRIDGYTTYADKGVVGYTGSDMYDTIEETKLACDAEPSCWSFNNNLEVYTAKDVVLGPSSGVCTYVKSECPSYSGFKLQPPGSVWVKTEAIIEVQYSADDDLVSRCLYDKPSACIAFDVTGRMIFPNDGFNAAWVQRNADAPCTYTYTLTTCPDKFGFFTYSDYILVPSEGYAGVNSGQMQTIEEAEAYCKITPKCSGFSSDGAFTVGGIKSVEFAYFTCSYIKHPCPPVNGYTAINGFTIKDFAPAASYPKLCFADLVQQCNADANCKSFDTLRNVWDIDVVQYHPFPGMCIYVKAQGFFGRINRRRVLGEKIMSAP
ncbi:hypothetical protein Vretimale_14209 [Volvox reticuliferus]|uniref:Uncharacterized protein n=1 Tax=Volvox reticuliferus TaxID=1737510 RepID=A0A8J4FUX9_9CHLO|nr:hypothetical protein Vretifemale_15177 [Volvox reticuliferus]GIM10551.1 hypothetical protein Vretimale_14209 [Volvox reticuliferus]